MWGGWGRVSSGRASAHRLLHRCPPHLHVAGVALDEHRQGWEEDGDHDEAFGGTEGELIGTASPRPPPPPHTQALPDPPMSLA